MHLNFFFICHIFSHVLQQDATSNLLSVGMLHITSHILMWMWRYDLKECHICFIEVRRIFGADINMSLLWCYTIWQLFRTCEAEIFFCLTVRLLPWEVQSKAGCHQPVALSSGHARNKAGSSSAGNSWSQYQHQWLCVCSERAHNISEDFTSLFQPRSQTGSSADTKECDTCLQVP